MTWRRYGRKRSWSNLRYFTGASLEVLRKTAKNLNQNSRFPDGDLNPGPIKYEAGMLITRPERAVLSTTCFI